MAIKVTLLTHTPNPEQTVAMAAKLCYSPSGIEDIREGLDEEKTSSFIDMLASLGHASPTEHAYFTFGIEGISRAAHTSLSATELHPTVSSHSAMLTEQGLIL